MTSTLLVVSRREATRSVLLERQLRRYHPHVQGKVRALAMRHTRLADLAASFPALLFALAVPRAGSFSARTRMRHRRPLALGRRGRGGHSAVAAKVAAGSVHRSDHGTAR
ncbi:hypothetical protein M2212_004356 [Bradyrhizobium elkanii]|nr:hypothetical protein [Bradyrhizobium elkanii]MCS3477510.1 hypothetical protein [Bradyrhizobium elkanii]BBB97389.1 hypothetical protein BE61_28220 [Bradyrhizobium elkanii USDA 61]